MTKQIKYGRNFLFAGVSKRRGIARCFFFISSRTQMLNGAHFPYTWLWRDVKVQVCELRRAHPEYQTSELNPPLPLPPPQPHTTYTPIPWTGALFTNSDCTDSCRKSTYCNFNWKGYYISSNL